MGKPIGLGGVKPVYASRAISGNAQYMPDATTILNQNQGATSDEWGLAALAALTAADGFLVAPNQDFGVQFVGNTGTGEIQVYDPVLGDWLMKIQITDGLMHVVRAPLLTFRIGSPTNSGTTHIKFEYMRQSGTP